MNYFLFKLHSKNSNYSWNMEFIIAVRGYSSLKKFLKLQQYSSLEHLNTDFLTPIVSNICVWSMMWLICSNLLSITKIQTSPTSGWWKETLMVNSKEETFQDVCLPPFSLRIFKHSNKQTIPSNAVHASHEQNMMKPEKVSEEFANANVSFKCIKKPKHLSCFYETQQFKCVRTPVKTAHTYMQQSNESCELLQLQSVIPALLTLL